MADTFAIISDIVAGWNEKLEMTNDELSKMVPFVELYAIYGPDSVNKGSQSNVSDSQTIQEGFSVNLRSGTGQIENVTLVPMFSLLEQQSSVDKTTKRLNKSRGIGGIHSLSVTIQNLELGSYIANVGITIPTFETEITTNNVLRKTVYPMTEWILMYGWAREGSGFPIFNPITENTIDLNDSHRGYYTILKTILFDFSWSVDSNKVMKANLRMGSPISNLMTWIQMSNYRAKVKNLLENPDVLISKHKTRNLPKEVFLSKEIDISEKSSNGLVKTQKEIKQFYYLGWIIEAIKLSVEPEEQQRYFKQVFFEDFRDNPKKLKFNFYAGNQKKQIDVKIPNCAYFPISKNAFNRIIDNEESGMSLIKQLCDEVNSTCVNLVDLTLNINLDGGSLSIVEANHMVWETNKIDKFKMDFTSINSLISGVSFEGRAARELTFGLQMLLVSNNGATDIYNIFKTQAADWSINDEDLRKKSYVSWLIRKFERENKSEDSFKTLGNRLERWKNYLSEKDSMTNVLVDVQSSNQVPVGFALKNYFMQLTLDIHGTAAFPPFSHIEFRGLLPGINGDYWVYETNDAITPASFETTIGCVLSEPFN